MAEHTANYNLEKQQENEFIDIQGINSNFDIIDALLKKNNQDNYRPNMLINGDFQIWQRGETFNHTSISGRLYTADRWCVFRDVYSSGWNASRSAEGIVCTNPADGKATCITQTIETKTVKALRGKTVTLSAKIKTPIATTIRLSILCRNDIEYIPGDGATSIPAQECFQIGTSFSTVSVTGIVPADAQGILVQIWRSTAGELTVEYAKLEVNDHATPFIPRSYGDELILCKRYYEAGDVSFALAKGVVYEPLSKFNVEKRITPTLIYQAPTDVNNIPIAQIVGATYPRTTTVGAIELSGVAQYPIINIKYTADAEI